MGEVLIVTSKNYARYYLEDLGVDGRVILKYILEKWCDDVDRIVLSGQDGV
jgi:hypothetical protein